MMAGKKAKGARAGRLRPSAVRLVLAWISFALMVFTLAGVLSSQLPQVQLVPALLAANFVVAALWLVLAFVVGRVYCAVVCPLGIGQDLVLWLSRRLTGKPRLSFVPERRALRYGVLTLAFLPLLLGVPGALLLLDPYSIFGRLVTDLFALPAAALRNGLAGLLEAHGAPLLLSRSEAVSALGASFALAAGYFLVLVVLSWRYGRWFCGNLCPVGTLLGTVSRVSRFRPVIDGGACVHCGRCERSCRASCIDAQQGKIDASRCVDCLDCLSLCPTGALRFGRPQVTETMEKPESAPVRRPSEETAPMETPETSRKASGAGTKTAASAAKSEASPQPSETMAAAESRAAKATKLEAMTEAARQTSEAVSVARSEASQQMSETMAAAESESGKGNEAGSHDGSSAAKLGSGVDGKVRSIAAEPENGNGTGGKAGSHDGSGAAEIGSGVDGKIRSSTADVGNYGGSGIRSGKGNEAGSHDGSGAAEIGSGAESAGSANGRLRQGSSAGGRCCWPPLWRRERRSARFRARARPCRSSLRADAAAR
jgi:polyferredoxin